MTASCMLITENFKDLCHFLVEEDATFNVHDDG